MKKLLLLIILGIIFSCSTPENKTEVVPKCNCVKTYYLYYPPMGNGSSYIPAHYEVVDQQVGNFNCTDETPGYVSASSAHYSHYKIECD